MIAQRLCYWYSPTIVAMAAGTWQALWHHVCWKTSAVPMLGGYLPGHRMLWCDRLTMAKKPRGPTRAVLLYFIHRQYPSLCRLLFCEACEMPPVGQAPHLVYLYKALELGFRNFRCEWQPETYEYFTCYAFFLQNSSCITLPMLKGSITLSDYKVPSLLVIWLELLQQPWLKMAE
jgi:hypothetical protein